MRDVADRVIRHHEDKEEAAMAARCALRWAWPMAAALCLQAASTAPAQEITLRVADSFPAGHYISVKVTRWFMDQVAERTAGRVKFQYYPAEQLGKVKDMLSLTQTGVADIAYVAPSFITDKLPLSGVAELPLGFTTSCEGTRAYYKLAADGIIADRELKPNSIRLLFTIVLPPYQIFLRGPGLKTIENVKGLKIRTSGKAKELAVQALGAVPIQIATPDVYQALSRGTIDGMLFPYASIYSYDLQDLIKSASLGANFGSFTVIYAIGERRWRSLPPEIQSVLIAVGQEATARGCQISQETETADQARLKGLGVAEIEFAGTDKARIAEEMSGIGKVWAMELDQRGKPGTQILDAFEKALH
jgi:TRAP-type C4-dicarboxylate transport system substrate-binding protein